MRNCLFYAALLAAASLVAVDSEDWSMHIEFDDKSADGTMTGAYSDGTAGSEHISLSR